MYLAKSTTFSFFTFLTNCVEGPLAFFFHSFPFFFFAFYYFLVFEYSPILFACQMSMENRKRTVGSSNFGSMPHWSLSFLQQPARVLIIEKVLPYWSETSKVICDALDNFLSLACSLDGPTRIPMFSLFMISRQQECLLPFVVKWKIRIEDFRVSLRILVLFPFSLFFCPFASLSDFSTFAATWPGCGLVWRSWGQSPATVASEGQPGEASCCNRLCWTVCSNLNSTCNTVAAPSTPETTTYFWRWEIIVFS